MHLLGGFYVDVPLGTVCIRIDTKSPNTTYHEWFTLVSGPLRIRGSNELDKIAIQLDLRIELV